MADYGYAHRELRRSWEPAVAAGDVSCARCGELIAPDDEWDLGHDDLDPTEYNGPEHRGRCNRRAGGQKRAAAWTRPGEDQRWAL